MDIILEILRALIVFVIFMYLLFTGKKNNLNIQNGWWFLINGFGLVLFGMMIDITDNFESLNRFIIIGDNEYQAFLEKVVGYLFGYLFLTIGICKWVPTVVALKKMQAELENDQNKLENEVIKRTQSLEEEVNRRKQAQHELAEFNNKLELLILNRTRQLKDTNQTLKKENSYRKQAEERLRQSLKDTKEMLEAMPFGVVVVGKDKKIRMANKASLNMLGIQSEEEILDNICHKRICPAKEDKCPVLDLGQSVDSSEKILVAYDGTQIPILKSVLPIHYGGEEVLLEAFVDISEIKKVETALISAKIEAETANTAKSEFLANMSHEFRTPLNHIIGFTQFVLDKSFGDLNEMQTDYLEDVSDSGSHLLSLINDILDLSKVESGKLELHTSRVKLRRLLENSLIIIKKSAVSRRLTLTNHLIDIPDTITADERKLKQILYNLLSNAVKFTPDGGKISLSARTCEKENSLLIPADEDSSHYVEISVSDNGIGLNPKDLDRIFNPFEQVDISSTKKFQGSGLGLSLTKSLIELHDGRIWVESDGEGKGSVFSCTIPMTPSDNISCTKNFAIVE